MSADDDLLAFLKAFEDFILIAGVAAECDELRGDGVVTIEDKDRFLSGTLLLDDSHVRDDDTVVDSEGYLCASIHSGTESPVAVVDDYL